MHDTLLMHQCQRSQAACSIFHVMFVTFAFAAPRQVHACNLALHVPMPALHTRFAKHAAPAYIARRNAFRLRSGSSSGIENNLKPPFCCCCSGIGCAKPCAGCRPSNFSTIHKLSASVLFPISVSSLAADSNQPSAGTAAQSLMSADAAFQRFCAPGSACTSHQGLHAGACSDASFKLVHTPKGSRW